MTEQPYLSQSEIGRMANAPHNRVIDLVRAGKFVPDMRVGRTNAFRRDRINELKALIAA